MAMIQDGVISFITIFVIASLASAILLTSDHPFWHILYKLLKPILEDGNLLVIQHMEIGDN